MGGDNSAIVMAQPYRLFIGYARKGEQRKSRLLTSLTPYKRNGLIKIWHDQEIRAGSDWRAEIGKAMQDAQAAIFMLDEDFLASEFCRDVEVATFLQRYRDDGVLILFVLADYCNWQVYEFIEKFQIIPARDKPITAHRPHSKAYTNVARAIEQALSDHRETSVSTRMCVADDIRSAYPEAQATAGLGLHSLLARLPSATAHLFGREAEIGQISAWRGHKGIFLWVADGGTGKSALVRWWLEKQEWPVETRFLGHSFYSQGSRNQATSSRNFLLEALKQLKIEHAANAADDELGRLLAGAVAVSPTVLVLDGIEPLQQVSGDEKLNGMVKDRGLAVLLETLARKPGQALCLVSSRLTIPESSIAGAPYFRQQYLSLLEPEGALQLLRQRGVRGEDGELGEMAERCGYHPLTLVLAAEFSHTFLQDRAAAFLAREWQPQPGDKHAASIMALFDRTLEEERQALDRELVRILGLFDRPAPWGALMALKRAAPISGLTTALREADEETILESLARLSQWGLLSADLTQTEPELDAHPLVREYFGNLLEREQPEAWRAAHNVLFDWFCKQPAKQLPDTLEEMEPLFRAVGHGYRAGRYRSAAEVIAWRTMRGGDIGYARFQLGGSSSILSALSSFFPNGWIQSPVAFDAILPSEELGAEERAWLVATVAQCLEFLGYLEDALVSCQNSRRLSIELQNWDNFSRSSFNLIDTFIPLGRWEEAEKISREALAASKQTQEHHSRQANVGYAFAALGRIRHSQGDLINSLAMFREAEAIQEAIHSRLRLEPPQLYGLHGYVYCQLLLERADRTKRLSEVLERGRFSLKFDKRVNHLLSIALSNCTIGSTLSALGKPDAICRLNDAVSFMKRADLVHGQPPMYLARAAYLRTMHNLPAAWEDHDAAHAIAWRGNMRTYLAECALLAGNLHLDEGRVAEAAAQYATAATLIHEDGYGRRFAELHLLHARLLHAQHDPAASQALAEAEARIREVGQWFFWRELQAVAQEIGAPDPGKCPK